MVDDETEDFLNDLGWFDAFPGDGPGPPSSLHTLGVSLWKSFLDGAFVWARRALNS